MSLKWQSAFHMDILMKYKIEMIQDMPYLEWFYCLCQNNYTDEYAPELISN